MGKRRDRQYIDFVVRNGKLYLSKSSRPVRWESLARMEDDLRHPTDIDRLNTLAVLLDFRAIKVPKEGTLLDEVIPTFTSKQELSRWRLQKIRDALD